MQNSNESQDILANSRKSELEKQVWDAIRLCYDPEIPVNIADLGLIYGIELTPFENSTSEYEVTIRMTLTTAGCPMSDYIIDEVKNRVGSLPFVKRVNVNLVFDPPWDRTMMSMQAKLELGML